ncbi:hypothetical protein CGK29_22510 [Vibrio parahaemolyticus]|nr:hypothetical protein CGK29_22510 [Vibrio parahaemolyticus]
MKSGFYINQRACLSCLRKRQKLSKWFLVLGSWFLVLGSWLALLAMVSGENSNSNPSIGG